MHAWTDDEQWAITKAHLEGIVLRWAKNLKTHHFLVGLGLFLLRADGPHFQALHRELRVVWQLGAAVRRALGLGLAVAACKTVVDPQTIVVQLATHALDIIIVEFITVLCVVETSLEINL